MSDEFLPKDYDGVPQGPSNYLRLEEGENIFRVLSSAVIGFEYWTGDAKNRKPVRVKTMSEVPSEYFNNEDNRDNAKYFWAFVVYNYSSKSIQIFEIKQKKIMKAIEALVKSKSWGNPKNYNIAITKTKTGPEPTNIEYSVMPEPKEPIDKAILQLYQDMNIDLSALYRGDDPFNTSSGAVGEEISADDIANDAVHAGL